MKKRILFILCLMIGTATQAGPAFPGWKNAEQPDGTSVPIRLMGDEYYHYWMNADGQTVVQNEEGYWVVSEPDIMPRQVQLQRQQAQRDRIQYAQSRRDAPTGVPRNFKGVVVLAQFPNTKFAPEHTTSLFQAMMTDDDYYSNPLYKGSVRSYFREQSNGLFQPEFTVVGPVTLSQDYTYYAGRSGTNRISDLVAEACTLADDAIDYSQYDGDGDNKVDFVCVIFAGHSRGDGSCDDCVWPCQVSLVDHKIDCVCDGVRINRASCSAELKRNGKIMGLGTFLHEFSHVLGLEDVYDVYYGSHYDNYLTPTTYHIMDWGLYNGDEDCPPNYSAYDKYYLGWLTPKVMSSDCIVRLPADGKTFYQIASGGKLVSAFQEADVYYVENRQKTGWDKELPDSGLLIWKIHYNPIMWNWNEINVSATGTGGRAVMNTTGKLHYELISASGQHHYLPGAGIPFPGFGDATFFAPTDQCFLSDIERCDSLITFHYHQGDSQAGYKYLEGGHVVIERQGKKYTLIGTPVR